ncbi:MAG: fimbrial biogenesis outer membrane usher protein, partial [Deltaproteobacteria bacterium]|nr:fimbrial biogenesis outer membrane usher protein [Deltaproteobacteria bacterium]
MMKLIFPRRCAALSIFLGILIFSPGLASKTALSQESAVLKLVLNQEDQGIFFLVLAPDNDVWIKRSDLDGFGLHEDLGRDISFDRDIYVALSTISGLNFHIEEKEVTLIVTAAPSLFKKQFIGSSYEPPHEIIYPKNGSAFLNYAVNHTSSSLEESFFDMSGELGISIGDYLGLSTFSYTDSDDSDSFKRLMTSITYNDREKLRTVIVGDFSALSGPLGSRQVLGGINLSKNFAIDPYLIQYPSLNLSGILETPSDIEVYMNGFLVRKERLSPGEFQFTDVPATVGLGSTNIIIKDAFGRERMISTPYYYTNRLLKKGFHEYSYSIGFQREDFGEKNFSYADATFLGFHNYALSNNITLGYTAEASENLINIGPTGSILLAELGTLDAALALSNSEGESGLSGFLGYSFQTRNINVRASLRYNSREYANLTLTPNDNKPNLEFSCGAGYSTRHAGTVALGYSTAEMHVGDDTTNIFLSYSKALTDNMTFFVIGNEARNTTTEREIFLGLHIYFGNDISTSINYTLREKDDQGRVRLQKSLPAGSGFGFSIEAENFIENKNFETALQYQNRYGRYEAEYDHLEDADTYRFSATGGIGYIDKSIFFSRYVYDSFAKVKVD